MDLFDLVETVGGLVIRFQVIGDELIKIKENTTVIKVLDKLKSKFNLEEWKSMQQYYLRNFVNALVILTKAPGNPCSWIGVRIGIALKRTFGLAVE